MSQGLPPVIDPMRLAHAGVRLQGNIPLAPMTRLPGGRNSAAQVSVDLAFEILEDGMPRVRGQVSTRLILTCQRCLQPLEWEVRADVDAPLLTPEQDRARADEAGEAIVAAGPKDLAEFVEDELILALPMMPSHRPTACPAARPAAAGNTQNPFAVLGTLKRRDE